MLNVLKFNVEYLNFSYDDGKDGKKYEAVHTFVTPNYTSLTTKTEFATGKVSKEGGVVI